MKFLATFLFLIVAIFLFLGQTNAQCVNAPRYHDCSRGYDSGHGGLQCFGGTRWYYNSGSDQCYSFFYYGCGGNSNRYCSLAACQNNCE